MASPKRQAPTESLLSRLALCQFLFSEAQRYLRRPDQYSPGLATSLAQDAVEAFLLCLAEHLQIPIGANDRFDTLIDKVGQNHPAVSGHKAAMTRLNRARINFKHAGINVPREDALVLQSNVREFLTEICKELLQIDFSAVSMVDAIGHDVTEDLLREAERALRNDDYAEVVEFSAKAACSYLKYRAGLNYSDEAYLGGIAIGSNVLQPLSYFDGDEVSLGQLRELANTMTRAHRLTNTLLLFLARGVDIASYSRFQALAPITKQSMDGSFRQVWLGGRRQSISKDDAQFCLRFVIDFALQLRRTAIVAEPGRAKDTESRDSD